MKKIAIVIAGCGNQDGTEVTEAVSLLISLSQHNVQSSFYALNKDFNPINHLNGEIDLSQKRNLLIEAGRIARGEVSDLATLEAKNFDGLAFAGGFGAAKHLCNWAEKQSACTVDPIVENVILDFYSHNNPIAALCISPVLLAKVLGSKKITITLGNDPETIAEVLKTKAIHEICPVDDFITDRDHKIITTPAYMYDAKAHEVFKGISGLVREFVEMA